MRVCDSFASAVIFSALCFACANGERHLEAIESADLQMARGEIDTASRTYDEVLARSPELPEALLGGARASLAIGDGEGAIARFSAYRDQGEPWHKVEQWEFCAALALGTDQRLANPKAAPTALEFALQLEENDCPADTTGELIHRSRLAISDANLRSGRRSEALEGYLALIAAGDNSRVSGLAATTRGKLGDSPVESPRERAYLSAAKLLSESGRRDEALALLSRGLDEFPSNRDLVHRMVTLLADGSSVVFPRAKPPGTSGPAATQ